VPVHLSAPPAAQVASIRQFLSNSGSVISSSGSSGNSGSGVSVGTGGIFGSGSPPPPASGTLTPDQAAAAEQAVTAFFAALGKGNSTALARTVVPSERSCPVMTMNGVTVTVKSLRILDAVPDGTGKATVLFKVSVTAKLGDTSIPVLNPDSGAKQWLVTTETGGHWYVDPSASSALGMGSPC
jgi:hypothetical protein